MKYRVKFTGRLKGAIGILDFVVVEVEAKDERIAELKLYDTYEHIMLPEFEEVTE